MVEVGEGDEKVSLTPNHAMFVKAIMDYRRVGDLVPGDVVRVGRGSTWEWKTISMISSGGGVMDVYFKPDKASGSDRAP